MTRLIDADDRVNIDRTTAAAAELIQAWYRRQGELHAGHRAAGALFVHATNCWKSICKLLDNCPSLDEITVFSNGAAAILRSLHDTCLQQEYILTGDQDKSLTSEALGMRYLDYETVEKYRRASQIDNYKSAIAQRLANSPKRAAGEPLLREAYEKVKANYPRRTHWYPRDHLADLARSLGREEHYFFLLSQYNSSVHGGPSAVLHGPVPSGADLYLIAMNLLSRAGRLLIEAIDVRLSDSSSEIFEEDTDLLNIGDC